MRAERAPDTDFFRELTWVFMHVDEGSWGAGGHVIRFQQLREAAKAEREKTEAPTTA